MIYVAAVIAHFMLLKPQSEFPLLATDEVQYTSVGENLRLGNGFDARGEFHAGLPPLYPLFVAFAHNFGSDPRISALWLSCLVICLAVFPAYGLARHAGLDRTISCVLAAAAAFLPNTLWAGLYMAETLNYPLFLACFWILAQWVETPTVGRGWIAGVLLSAMVLTKVAAWSFVAAVAITIAILALRRLRTDRFGLHAVRIFGVVAVTEIGWQIFKQLHHAAGLGMYGAVLGEFGLPNLSPSLLGAYFADFLLAPGLVVAVPLFLWFRTYGRERFNLSVLLAATLVCELAVHSFLEAGLTGFLKERLILYSFPIIAIFAVKGIDALGNSSAATKPLLVAVPFVLLGLLGRYAFPYNPVIDIPWASALGSSFWIGVDSFSKIQLTGAAALLILIFCAVLLLIRARWMQIALATFVLGFCVFAFVSSATEMTQLSRRGKSQVDGVVYWLSSNHVNAGDRLILCGRMAYYQERHRSTPFDAFFVNWHERLGFTEIWNFQLETFGRYDVRMAQTVDQLRALLRPGDHLLTATRFTGLDLISYRYPLYLYTARKPLASDPRPLYTFDITAEQVVGKMLSGPIDLPAGNYRATLHVGTNPESQVAIEAVTKNRFVIVHREGPSPGVLAFEFQASGDSPIQFLLGSEGQARSFQELTLEYKR